jgi:hypothetical protein
MITVIQAVDNIYLAAVDQCMDVSPRDVAFIICSFLEVLAGGPYAGGGLDNEQVNNWLLMLADEVSKVRDE